MGEKVVDVYKEIPVFEGEYFTLRAVLQGDLTDLWKVYSDEKAVPLFNSDNCHGDTFYCDTYPLFSCDKIATKAIPAAKERIAVLEKLGLAESREKLIGEGGIAYGNYFVRGFVKGN